MEWISALLQTTCPFCLSTLGHPARACVRCAMILAHLETEPAIIQKIGHLQLVAGTEYQHWIQSLVLRQKTEPSKHVSKWMARLVWEKMPDSWRTVPVVWVPGRTFGGIHLVESIALELRRCGATLASRALLRRKMAWFRKSQKELGLEARLKRDLADVYAAIGGAVSDESEVILLDDVVTTGATVLGCAKVLQERLGIRCLGALAVAFTPRRREESALRPDRSAGCVRGTQPDSL